MEDDAHSFRCSRAQLADNGGGVKERLLRLPVEAGASMLLSQLSRVRFIRGRRPHVTTMFCLRAKGWVCARLAIASPGAAVAVSPFQT